MKIVSRIDTTLFRRSCLQLLLICAGFAISVLLIDAGIVESDIYDILTAPFLGLLFQFQSFLFIKIQPIGILFFGIIGFIVFILLPGTVFAQLISEKMDPFTRILIGTSLPLLTFFLIISYGLLFGLAPHWIIIVLPLSSAFLITIFNPKYLRNTTNDFRQIFSWIRRSILQHKFLWLLIVVMASHRIALFSITDSYWTDSVRYVAYAEAIEKGSLFMGMEFIQPVGYSLVAFPFTWLTGSISWGLALANFCLAPIAILGSIPILRRLYATWPTSHKPPFSLVAFAVISFPWLTLEMTIIFTEVTLFFFTILTAATVMTFKKYPEIWLGVSAGTAFLIRPTHAVLFLVFILYPLFNARRCLKDFTLVGVRSLIVAVPVAPWLIRNLLIEGTFIASPDLAYFGLNNVIPVLIWLGNFVVHPEDGVFTLLFILPLLVALVRFVPRLSKIDIELRLWFLLSAVSLSVFLLWPTDQPRFYAYFLWLLPLFFILEMWEMGWQLTAYLFIIWQFMIFGAFPFGPLGWLIRSASSLFPSNEGILRPYPPHSIIWIYILNAFLLLLWLLLVVRISKQRNMTRS